MNLSYILIRLARRGLLAFCALFALLALLGSQALPVSAATTPSLIRLINASPDVGTVNVFVDGAKFLGNAYFASITDYLQLPSGPHKVELALIGKSVGAAVIVQKLSVQAGAAYTVAAIGTKSTGFSLQVFVDDNRMVSGMATVRVYDLSPQSGTLSVAAGTNTLIGPVSYRQASNYQRLAAGLYTFTFSSSQPTFTLVDQVTLKTGTVTSFFVVGVLHGTPQLVVNYVQVKGLPRLLAGTGSDPNALPMPVNASELVPLIVLPLGVLALAGIAVAWFTRFWPFSRQKGSSRPRKLFGAALGALLALILSLGGLSFASFMTHPAPAPTARLLIPAIGVNAPIESVGVQPNGAMETPRQSPWSDVGLYTGGPRPGDRGSAVIAGHLDRPGGNPAAFWLLRELHIGDEVQFVDAHDKILLFHVTRIEAYPVQDAPVQVIFGDRTGRFLNLTTCAGDWIPTQHQRTMRLVVYTSFGPAPANTSTVTSSAPLTSPSSSSHAAPPTTVPSSSSNSTSSTAAPSSSSSSTSSTAAPSSSSSSVSSAPTPPPLPSVSLTAIPTPPPPP
jgi:sortase (surface protein transpeptidase)